MLESIHFPAYDAQIYLQGAHLASFKDWLFLSAQSNFAEGKAIRGGIPVIFPYFGANKTDKSAPQHGFARTSLWTLESRNQHCVSLVLNKDGFDLRLTYEFGDTLQANLSIENRGETPRKYEVALHTYFAVSDVRAVVVKGVDGKEYLDKVDGFKRKTQSGHLRLNSATDRVYLDCGDSIKICDFDRSFRITGNSMWKSTIIWNPFDSMSDVAGDSWKKFVCVESGAVADDAPTLEAGGRHDLSIEISLL